GDWEERISPIEEAIVSSKSDSVIIQMPAKAGNYRLFAYVYDHSGKVATANLPIRVEAVK
ncbi:MAG: glycoside hydrolase family 2 TIM barrel-domain containing protein, partial [Planctomycetota bacterium]